jgi:hypothetical protein
MTLVGPHHMTAHDHASLTEAIALIHDVCDRHILDMTSPLLLVRHAAERDIELIGKYLGDE